MQDRIFKVVSYQLGVNVGDVTPESTVTSLGCDSLDEIELIMAIEDEFEIEISDEAAKAITKMGDIQPLVERLLAAKRA